MAVFAVRRRVSWGDCDPAGILYTPRAFDYGTEALERWYAEVFGTDWLSLKRSHNIGSPMVHASCDYLKAMAPGLEIDVQVRIGRIGESSLTFRVEGVDLAGSIHFRAKYVACITDASLNKAVAIPPALRLRAEAYLRECGDQPDPPG